MYTLIKDSLKYTVIENVSKEAFQALWVELHIPKKTNISCCVVYRQHNSPGVNFIKVLHL